MKKKEKIYESGGRELDDIESVEERDVRNAERVEIVGLEERCRDLRKAINYGRLVKVESYAYKSQAVQKQRLQSSESAALGIKEGTEGYGAGTSQRVRDRVFNGERKESVKMVREEEAE